MTWRHLCFNLYGQSPAVGVFLMPLCVRQPSLWIAANCDQAGGPIASVAGRAYESSWRQPDPYPAAITGGARTSTQHHQGAAESSEEMSDLGPS
jgi:hypothetical protein